MSELLTSEIGVWIIRNRVSWMIGILVFAFLMWTQNGSGEGDR